MGHTANLINTFNQLTHLCKVMFITLINYEEKNCIPFLESEMVTYLLNMSSLHTKMLCASLVKIGPVVLEKKMKT